MKSLNKERLDKIISSQFNISRSEAKVSIRRGQVLVGGTVAKDSGMLVTPETEQIIFNGERLAYKKNIYIIMNKPRGVLSASTDKSRKTVVDILPEELKRSGLFPAGRLDRDTTGLLIITDDGDFAHRIISPKKKIKKTYIVWLDADITPDICRKFSEGVTLSDGTLCAPSKLTRIDKNVAEITITEGKYHQIKRMFGTVGIGVNELHRKSIGGLTLPENITEGLSRELTEMEKNSIFMPV